MIEAYVSKLLIQRQHCCPRTNTSQVYPAASYIDMKFDPTFSGNNSERNRAEFICTIKYSQENGRLGL